MTITQTEEMTYRFNPPSSWSDREKLKKLGTGGLLYVARRSGGNIHFAPVSKTLGMMPAMPNGCDIKFVLHYGRFIEVLSKKENLIVLEQWPPTPLFPHDAYVVCIGEMDNLNVRLEVVPLR